MKNFLFGLGLIFTLNAMADIEYIPSEAKKTSGAQIETNRACFKELEAAGCGDPLDHEHFRSCMNNAYDSLTENCQKLMTKLYK